MIRRNPNVTLSRACVLIVDDQEWLRQLLEGELKDVGLEVLLAENGEVAWKILLTQVISVVVTDKDMPQLDGLALIERIRGAGSDVPIVLFTGDESDATRETALALGATHVVKRDGGVEVVVDAVIEFALALSSTS